MNDHGDPMSQPATYDYWREYPEHDPQSFVWYPLTFGPLEPDLVWPTSGDAKAVDSSFFMHIPFCAVICPFCPFNKFKSVEDQMREFVRTVKLEISMLAARRDWGKNPLRAGYFGGGTPTALSGDHLCEIIEHVKKELVIPPGFEMTVEGSPETITPEKLAMIRQSGVNRVSFGVQSFSDHYLKILGRGHDAATARKTIEMVRTAGFDDVAIDLMYRLPGQTLEEWVADLDTAVASGVTHISAYSLFIEPGSPLAKVQHRGRLLPMPDDETDLEMFRIAIERLGEAGYELYTLYDFAKPGRQSDHHLVNWQAPQAEYVAVGAGAFGFVRNGEEEFVYGNINPLERYFETVDQGKLPIDFGIQLPREERMARYMVLGTNAPPIPKEPFAKRFGVTVEQVYGPEIAQLVEWGLIEDHPDRIDLTLRGKLYISNVGKMFSSERNKRKPHPAGVDLQKGAGMSLLGIEGAA